MEIPEYIQSQIAELDAKIQETETFLADPDMKDMALEEIAELKLRKQEILDAITKEKPQTEEPVNPRLAIVEIRSAAGGDEAKNWANDLYRMYLRYAELQDWKVTLLEDQSFKLKGKDVYNILKYESGVHRVQRVPETEKNGRIHTSTATVAVLPIVNVTVVEVRPDDCRMDYFRSGGAGGQNVNKVNTGVRITHIPTGVVVECTQKRTQYENREIAEEILRGRLWQIEEDKRLEKIQSQRAESVGRGMRSEKIRTYNYPQNRVTDHRIGKSWYDLENIVSGNLDKVFQAIAEWEQNGAQESDTEAEQED